MGAVRDAAALEAARALMKVDTIFRDAALFFQRRFDAVLVEIAVGATDAELARLADTRSGRAFRLMAGRAARSTKRVRPRADKRSRRCFDGVNRNAFT